MIEALDNAAASERASTRGLRFVDRREREQLVSWSEVVQRAEATARALRTAGVEPGDRVALVFGTCPEFFDAFFGSLMAGAVPVPLYPPLRLGKMEQYDERTAAMLKAAGARLVLAEPRVRRLLGGVMARHAAPLGYLTPAALAKQRGSQQAPEQCALQREPDDLALVQFSSGTTVQPKAVALSHSALLHQASILAGHWPDTASEEQSGVSWLPLYHDMGLIGCVIPALLRVANLWLIPPELFLARPALWLKTLSRSRATVSPAPNFAYSLCCDRIQDRDLEGVDLSSWRAALNGAEAVSMDTVRRFTQRFAAVGFSPSAMTPVYGLAEAALAVTFSDLDAAPLAVRFDRDLLSRGRAEPVNSGADTDHAVAQELVSVGQPVPGFAVEVRDAHGVVVDSGIEGEVFAKGPSLLSGYLGANGALSDALQAGWLATGDLGFVCAGRLFLSGRDKDVLVLRGRNWSPVPIEEQVSAVPGVRTGCVVAVSALLPGTRVSKPGADAGQADATEQLWVIAETREPEDGHPHLSEEVRAAVLAATGLTVARLDLVQPGEIPRTSSGKLRRAAAKAQAEAGRLQPAGRRGLGERLRQRPSVEAALAILHSQRARGDDDG